MRFFLCMAFLLMGTLTACKKEHGARLFAERGASIDVATLRSAAKEVIRVDVRWNENDDTFKIEGVEIEKSGTEAFSNASRYNDPHGSFKARLVDPSSDQAISYSVLGTGVYFKRLVRVLTFRFPMPEKDVRFELLAEHNDSGKMENVVRHDIQIAGIDKDAPPPQDVEVRMLREAQESPKLIVNVYAEGYSEARREVFFTEAAKIHASLEEVKFPKQERMEFRAVFAPSNTALGMARDPGLPVQARDSFLGLYFPYWQKFGRWYNVVYPTSPTKYRRALASVPYDYPIALIDDDQYWGVGNFKELTAIPARSESFEYLLLHEFGHFFGLNEEYDKDGPTELAFAPQIEEPWSQNITLKTNREHIKWASFIDSNTPVPTNENTSGAIGLYPGGYAKTPTLSQVFIPGLQCVMRTQTTHQFCPVCAAAIAERIDIDLGLKNSSTTDDKPALNLTPTP